MFWTWLAISRKIIFRFLKRCSGAREQYFWDFWFVPRKISRWKNLFIFQRLMFLYQLVNLVLETCFIFSKTLKLSKTFSSWVSRVVRSYEQRALWFPYSIFWNKNVQESVNSWVFWGVLQSQLWCPSWIFFDTSLSERCFIYWLVTEIITLSSGRHVLISFI